jgi:hypothetical protein
MILSSVIQVGRIAQFLLVPPAPASAPPVRRAWYFRNVFHRGQRTAFRQLWQPAPDPATGLRVLWGGRFWQVEEEERLYPLGYFSSERNAWLFVRDLERWRAGKRSRPASNHPKYR